MASFAAKNVVVRPSAKPFTQRRVCSARLRAAANHFICSHSNTLLRKTNAARQTLFASIVSRLLSSVARPHLIDLFTEASISTRTTVCLELLPDAVGGFFSQVFTMSAQASTAQLSQDELKKQAAWKAVDYVKSGMVVGLGTGSTAAFAVDRLGQLLKDGQLKDIVGVPTSVRTYEQAKSLGIPLATLDEQPKIDVAIDGADEVDPNLDVVKGRGGALLREKMVEKASKKFVCIVDDTKLVEGLGGSKLAMPVEITQFCHKYTQQR